MTCQSYWGDPDGTLTFMGMDLRDSTTRENLAVGVVEPVISKIKKLRFLIEAAITILGTNNKITLNNMKGLVQQ